MAELTRNARACLLGLALVVPPAVSPAAAAGRFWPRPSGPFDGTRCVDTGKRPRSHPLSGYRTDLVHWRTIDHRADQLCTGDLDGDGYTELVALSRAPVDEDRPGIWQTWVTAFDNDLSELWDEPIGPLDGSGDLCVWDLDGDGTSEVIVARGGGAGLLGDSDVGGHVEVWFGGERRGWSWKWRVDIPEGRHLVEATLYVPLAGDFDGDGKWELCVFRNLGTKPDADGRTDWQRDLVLLGEDEKQVVASVPFPWIGSSGVVADLDGDGRQELIFGGYAQSNGAEATLHVDGRNVAVDDSRCNLSAFDSRLRPRWVTGPIGAQYASVRPAVLSGSGILRRTQLLAFCGAGGSAHTAWGELRLVASKSGQFVRTFAGGACPGGVFAGPVMEDSADRPVFFDQSGRLTVVDRALKGPESEWAFGEGGTQISFGADLDGDGRSELVLRPIADAGASLADLSYGRHFVSLSVPPPVVTPATLCTQQIAPWDVDGDGCHEVVVATRWEEPKGGERTPLPAATPPLAVFRSVPARPLVGSRRGRAQPEVSNVRSFSWLPSGEALLLHRQGNVAEVRRWDRKLGPSLHAFQSCRAAAFSADSGQVAAVVGGESLTREPVVVCVGSGEAGQGSQREPADAAWTGDLPAGAHVEVFVGARLVVFDLRTGRTTEIASGDLAPPLAWTPDGRLLVSKQHGDTLDVCLIDPGVSEILPIQGASTPYADDLQPVSFAGDRVAFLRWEYAGHSSRGRVSRAGQNLRHVPLAGGIPESLGNGSDVRRALEGTRPAMHADLRDRLVDHWRFQHNQWGSLGAFHDGQALVGQMRLFTEDADGLPWLPDWFGTEDLWYVNAHTKQLHALTFENDCDESDPDLSPDGNWVAYVSRATFEDEPTDEIVVTNLTGSSRLTVGPGTCPRWSPSEPGVLWFLRDGTLMSARLQAWSPPRRFERKHVALAGMIGALLAGALVWLRLPTALGVLVAAWMTAFRLARAEGHSILFTDLIRRLDRTHGAIHALKNGVTAMPVQDEDGNEDPVATVSYVFDEDNVKSIRASADEVERRLDELARRRRDDAAVLRGASPEIAASFRQTIDLLLASRALMAQYRAAFERDFEALRAASTGGATPDRAICQRALDNLNAFYALLTDERERAGRMDLLRDCLKLVNVRAMLDGVASATKARAASLGAVVEVAPDASPLAHVPGDPSPLRQVVLDAVANSLDAIAERGSEETDDHQGRIVLNVADTATNLTITIADNGIGVEPAIAEQLNRGQSVSTKGATRGGGLWSAHRMLWRYAGGSLRLASKGPGTGAVVTIALRQRAVHASTPVLERRP